MNLTSNQMGIFDFARKPTMKATNGNATPSGDVVERESMYTGIYKAYIPEFLYKPPFGFPRPESIPLLKQFAKNPYIFSVINALQEEAASNAWEIIPSDEDGEMTPDLKSKAKLIQNFLNNPNTNKQGFAHLLKCAVRDICEVDAGVWNKVFNKNDQMVQLLAVDGGSILMNPDVFGNLGNRADIIFPTNLNDLNAMYTTASAMQSETRELARNQYALTYSDQAAYFQYGWTVAALPVPFGRRELVYMMKNPRAGSIYGISPVAILADTILTLVYGLNYNLDFYMNSNIPEGIISIPGADGDVIKAFQEKMKETITIADPMTGMQRKIAFKAPVTNTPATFVPFQLPSKDMQIIEQQAWFTKLVWMCFGLSEEDLGITSDSNNAVSQTMFKRYTRKAVRPILRLLAERINQEIIPELDPSGQLMFKWDDYDIEEDIKRHELYKMQIEMGIKTPEMVAKEEKIDITELKKSQAEQDEREVAKNEALNPTPPATATMKSAGKLEYSGNAVEAAVKQQLDDAYDSISKDLELQGRGSLANVR